MTSKEHINRIKLKRITFEAKYFYITLRMFVESKSNDTYIVFNRKLSNIYKFFTGYSLPECEKIFKELSTANLINVYKSNNNVYTIHFI